MVLRSAVAELGIFGAFVAEGGEVRCNKVGKLADMLDLLQFWFWQIGDVIGVHFFLVEIKGCLLQDSVFLGTTRDAH